MIAFKPSIASEGVALSRGDEFRLILVEPNEANGINLCLIGYEADTFTEVRITREEFDALVMAGRKILEAQEY